MITSTVHDDPHLRHWHDRNWSLALEYYLASADSTAPLTVPPVPAEPALPGLRLPPARPLPATSAGEVMFRRCAVPRLPGRTLDADVLAGILGHTSAAARRTAGAGTGATWSDAMDVLVVAYDVHDVPPGWYWSRETPDGRVLTGGAPMPAAELRDLMQRALIGQEAVHGGAATFILTLNLELYQRMLPIERGLREAYVDAGRYAHYLLLGATAYGLRTHQSPAVQDSLLLALTGVDELERHILYTVTVG